MARIVLGMGTSHTPMLLASDETLQRFVETDQMPFCAVNRKGCPVAGLIRLWPVGVAMNATVKVSPTIPAGPRSVCVTATRVFTS